MTQLHSDIFSDFGEPLTPNATEVLHSFEDRLCLSDADSRQYVVEKLRQLSQSEADRGVIDFSAEHWSFQRLARLGQWRRFLKSQRKCGMHVRTSCLVTDGHGHGAMSQVLTATGATLCGAESSLRSLLFSSPKVRHAEMEANPHHISSVLGDRLILAASEFESRLAFVAYDLRSPETDVLDFIWHVRVASPLPGAVIPQCDLPFTGSDYKGPFRQSYLEWRGLNDISGTVSSFDAQHADILQRVLAASAPTFVPNSAHCSPVWLLKLYQQAVHAGTRLLSGGMSLVEFRDDLLKFFRDELPGIVSVGDTTVTSASDQSPAPFRAVLTHCDEVPLIIEQTKSGHSVGVSLALQDSVVVSESYAEMIGDWYERHPELRSKLNGLTLVCGVRQCRPYVCHNPLSLWHSPLPVEVVRIAVNPRSPRLSVRGVAHAVIPFEVGGPDNWKLVVTRQRHDESTRLPGGKLEFGETPEQAVRRECFEELGLEDSDIAVLRPIPMPEVRPREATPEGSGYINEHVTRLVSPKTGELTCYLLYPYWIELTASGREKILAQLGKPKHFPKLIDANFWRSTGLGYDREYPTRICASIRDWLQPAE